MNAHRPFPVLALVLLSTLAVAPGLAAQPPEATVTWEPHDPSVEDVVLLNISGIWRDGCIPHLAAIHRDPLPEDFPVLYPDPDVPEPIAARWAVVLEPFEGGCVLALTPYSVDVALAHPPAGNNRVLVQVHDSGLEPPEDFVLDLVSIPVSGPTDTLSLHGGRFRVTVSWRAFGGHTGQGLLIPGRSHTSGLFSFFSPDNWEVLVKVLDGCTLNGHYWVFVAAATNVEYTVRVEDLVAETVWERTNPLGELSRAYADVEAFAPCSLP